MNPILTSLLEPAALQSREWMVDASCAQLPLEIVDELLFPDEGGRPKWLVQKMCARCPVKRECFDAGADEEYGTWGGVQHTGKWRIKNNALLALTAAAGALGA